MGPLADAATYFAVREFLALEIGHLQAGRYEQWLALFAPNARYWMPLAYVRDTRADAEAHASELAHFDDSFETLRLRVDRLTSKRAWTETPPSRVRYFIEPCAIELRGAGQIFVTSNFLIHQSRLQRDQAMFSGLREDTLQGLDYGFRIVQRRIVLDQVVIPAKNLSIFF